MDGGDRELVGTHTLADTADVVVIGAGVAGLSVAKGLSEAGVAVVVIDAHAVGDGASAQGSGHLLSGVVEHPCRVEEALGTRASTPLYALCRDSRRLLEAWGIPVGPAGWWVALDEREPQEIEASARALTRMGTAAEVVPPAEVATQLGLENPGPALRVASEGVVDPKPALAVLARAVRSAGGQIAEHTPVTQVVDGPEGVVVRCGEQSVHAEVVVYAAGAHGPGLDPYFADKITPVRDQAVVVGHPSPGPAGRAGYAYTWWRPEGSDVVVGGMRWAMPHLGMGDRDPVLDDRVQTHLDGFHTRLGASGPALARRAWIEAHTCDGLPIVGPLPGSMRHIACTGFVGNDWGIAPAAAQTIAHGLVGEGSAEVLPLLAATRFQ